jgi:ferredoxin-2, mitochondrial
MPFDTATGLSTTPSTAKSPGLTVNVRMPDGGWVAPPALAGERLVDALGAFGLPLRGVSGASCGCRGRIRVAWLDRLDPPAADEAASLDALGSAHANSRLLCHIVMTGELDGLEVELDWDALEPQTYWVAG